MKRKDKGRSYTEDEERGCDDESAPKADLTSGLRKKACHHGSNLGNLVSERVRKFEDLSKNATSSQKPHTEHHTGINATFDIKPGQFQLAENPSVLKTIRSPYEKLRNCKFAGRETIWISDNDKNVCQINFEEEVLDGSTLQVENEVNALGLNLQQQLIFSLSKFCPHVFKFDGKKLSKIKNLYPWNPKGLCYTKNGDLLVSMSSEEDGARVVRYVETSENNFKEIRVIQNDQYGQPLFSKGIDLLLLTENGNEDICVADRAGEKVLVFHGTGDLRFIYRGNVTIDKSEKRSFRPNQIATDVNSQILIKVFSKYVHVIDQYSSFICYIKCDCSGGLSIDADHNLLAGDYFTGEIKVIKYLEK